MKSPRKSQATRSAKALLHSKTVKERSTKKIVGRLVFAVALISLWAPNAAHAQSLIGDMDDYDHDFCLSGWQVTTEFNEDRTSITLIYRCGDLGSYMFITGASLIRY
jgi:hypothetical protein